MADTTTIPLRSTLMAVATLCFAALGGAFIGGFGASMLVPGPPQIVAPATTQNTTQATVEPENLEMPQPQPESIISDDALEPVPIETSDLPLPGPPHRPAYFALLLSASVQSEAMVSDDTLQQVETETVQLPLPGPPHRPAHFALLLSAAEQLFVVRVLPGPPHRLSDAAHRYWTELDRDAEPSHVIAGPAHRPAEWAYLLPLFTDPAPTVVLEQDAEEAITAAIEPPEVPLATQRRVSGPAHRPAEWALLIPLFGANDIEEAAGDEPAEIVSAEHSEEIEQDAELPGSTEPHESSSVIGPTPHTMPELVLLLSILGTKTPEEAEILPSQPTETGNPASTIVVTRTWHLASLDQPGFVPELAEVAIAPVPGQKPELPDNVAIITSTEYGPEPDLVETIIPIDPAYEGAPLIAIVIDDLGLNRRRAERVAALPGPLTMAFIPYGSEVADLARLAANAGHEVFLHLPMEPTRASEDPGPHALLAGLTPEQLRERLLWNLERFDGYVGVNNHMGSLLTQDAAAMNVVMAELDQRGLIFVDSVTSAASVAYTTARDNGIPTARRDVFLDNVADIDAIEAQLRLLEDVARRQGFAIGIGHPHDATVEALSSWL
ncbi:MAG: hypothetical protein HOI34_03050, partial [Rhodospirillaceae bacterium]|nr:hypothetical protein [Rhodospirillaceae bacterium]